MSSGNGLLLPAETPKRHRSPRHSIVSETRDDASGRGHPSEADKMDKMIEVEKLLEAAGAGDDAIVRRLLDAGVNVNATDRFGRTPLQIAAESGHKDVVEMLVDARADIDALPEGSFGRTALQVAAGNGHKAVVRSLLEAGANVNILPSLSSGRTALQAAAEYGHEQVVYMLLKAGADVEAPPSPFYGRTALQAAAGAGNEKMVKILLDAGANINALPCETFGRTALQAASEAGHEGVVSMLLEREPDLNAPSSSPNVRTALQAAAENGHQGVVLMLLGAGAKVDVSVVETDGKTALQAAAGAGHEEIVKILLRADTSSDAGRYPNYGAEALEAAAAADHESVVKILLEGGVNINSRDISGRTCMFSQNLRGEMLRALLRLGAYIDAQDSDGSTPLHWAAQNRHTEILVNLLEAGADMGIKDNRTRRPLEVALECGHEDIVKLLLEKGDDIRNSRVGSWRSILSAKEKDIIMIHSNVDGGIRTAISVVDIGKVDIGIESDDSHQTKKFYSSFGLVCDGASNMRLINPRCYMSKYLALDAPEAPEKSPKTKAEIQWMWALVNPKNYRVIKSSDYGSGVPSIGHIATTAQTKALLTCYLCFDFYVHVPSAEPRQETGEASFVTQVQQSQISWVMLKTESPDRRSNSIFRSMNYRSNMEYGWVPNHGVDFVAMFIGDLENKWKEVIRVAELHLKEIRKSLLLKEGKTTNLIGTLLRDAQKWSDFKALLKVHVLKAKDLVKDFQEKRLLYEEVKEFEESLAMEDDAAETATLIEESTEESTELEMKKGRKKEKKRGKGKKKEKGREKNSKKEARTEIEKLSQMIDKMKRECKDQIEKLEKKTKEMIELEFNLVSIFEARVSTMTAVSMKRLTWITFVFLPLLFTASLFGMNIDLLGNNNVNWWWYAILSVLVFIMVLAGWACIKHYGMVEKWCEHTLSVVAGSAPPLPFAQWRKKGHIVDEEKGERSNKFKSS